MYLWSQWHVAALAKGTHGTEHDHVDALLSIGAGGAGAFVRVITSASCLDWASTPTPRVGCSSSPAGPRVQSAPVRDLHLPLVFAAETSLLGH